ncbi:hypothetical protein DSL72_002931 [Monilinia vaccinii-corymbosi]|uniref:Uncharacterized protein n=1 Tax=Monilinia vaccinii-corymbosi TaxID=61207 RepID=A0A8A3PE58_9HELO|nr:hypothetical protein DSL72_002931 [Monilinia vaccinii-corymbosi]
MSHHGSWGRSDFDRTTYRSNAKFPTPGKPRSMPSDTDDLSTSSRGRSNKGYKTYLRIKPVVKPALRCLVGKFEAMDALSLPIQDPTLQPAPLHSARNSPRRRGIARESSQRRLSPILSPNSTGLSKDDDVFVDEYVGNNACGDTLSSPKSTILRSPMKQFHSRRLRTPQHLGKVVKTPSRRVNLITPSRPISKHRNTTGGEFPTYVLPQKSPNKTTGSIIKDRIRFFDGSPDENNLSSPPKISPPKTNPSTSAPRYYGYRHNAQSSPPSCKTGAETPIFRALVGVPKNVSRTSELAKEESASSSPAKSQYSLTSRKQRKVFGEAFQNPFLNSQESLGKTRSSMAISPHTSPMKPQLFFRIDSETKADSSPRGRSLARYEVNTTPTPSSELTKIPRPRGRTIPSRRDLKTGIQKDIDTRRDQISEKIEAIYQAKSEERKGQSREKTLPQASYEVSPIPKNDGRDDVRRPQRIKDTTSFRSKSKVADMRMRFDGGASFASPVLPGSASKDAKGSIPPMKDLENSATMPLPPPTPPPPVFSSHIHGNAESSSKHPMPAQHNPSPKPPTPRTQTPSKSLMQRVSMLPLEKLGTSATMPGCQPTPQKEDATQNPAPSAQQRVEKSALQTWPRSIRRPKPVRSGLIADRLRIFEEISKRNDGVVVGPGREMKRGFEGGKGGGAGKIARLSLVEGRKERFEVGLGPDGDGDGDGDANGNGKGDEKKLKPVLSIAVVAKGKEKETEKEEKRCEKRNINVEVEELGEFEVSPVIKEKLRVREDESAGNKGSPGSKGPRLGRRRFVGGRWNEICPPSMGGEELAHLPVKRGLRDGRMHMGRDGSHSIDWEEVEREIEREGGLGLDLGMLNLDLGLEVLVGRGKGRGKGKGGCEVEGIRDASVKRGRDVNMSRGEDLHMVIKEAECGLKEPKPLRVVEMKRMVDICRDRDRERERVRERIGLGLGLGLVLGGGGEERDESRGRKLERRK